MTGEKILSPVTLAAPASKQDVVIPKCGNGSSVSSVVSASGCIVLPNRTSFSLQ